MKPAIIVIVIVLLLGILGPQMLFTVDETQLVVVTQFGEVKSVKTTPGLKTKLPFLQKANTFDKRVLRIDTPPARLNDSEKQILVIDAYTRYRITDVRLFFEKLRTPSEAESRIGQIVTSKLKEEVADRTRAEIIGGLKVKNEEGVDIIVSTNSRQEILDAVLIASNLEVGPETKMVNDETGVVKTVGGNFGITIMDVRIKRADFSGDIRETTFTRMRAERERISRETRALGAEQDAIIRANVDREKAIILADADRRGNLIKGEGEAKAIEIFARALEQDPEFYAFQRSLDAYKKFLPTNTTVILSSDAELFQFLQDTEFIPVQKPKAIVGSIENLSDNLWTVDGRDVRVNGSTRVKLSDAPNVGLPIFVEGSIQEDTSIVASQVLEGVRGLLEKISVVQLEVDDQVILINEGTKLQIDPQRATVVYVEADTTDNGLVAKRITEGVRGTLESVVGNIWTVGTTDIVVDKDTVIEDGADQTSADVLVSVQLQKDDSLLALNVYLQQPDGTVERLAGTAVGVVREWRVRGSDRVITVNEDSNIQLGAGQVGLVVLIGFERQDDGSLLALEGRIE